MWFAMNVAMHACDRGSTLKLQMKYYMHACIANLYTGKPSAANSGVTFCGESKIATITSSTSTVDMADVGVSLSIQQELDHIEKLEFSVRPCLTGPFVLPADYEAASPVYLIQAVGEIHTDVTVYVCIHHCASLRSEEDCRNMRFLSASPTSQVLTEISEVTGKFKKGSQIGEISLKELGFLVVANGKAKGL